MTLEVTEVCKTLIQGSHILHYHSVLDAYGHLSSRHPENPELFIMPRNMAPATITGMDDLVIYRVADASPVEENAPKGYIERFIHSEIYRAYPTVGSVLHSHCSDVVPFANSSVLLRPCLHMSGFLGKSTPIFEINQYYSKGDIRDLLIRTPTLGESLAKQFTEEDTMLSSTPRHSVTLMRGHGFTVVAPSVQECVFRGIYTRENAIIQTRTLLLNAAFHRGISTTVADQVHYLDDDEIEPTTDMSGTTCERAWALWVQEAKSHPLYGYNLIGECGTMRVDSVPQ